MPVLGAVAAIADDEGHAHTHFGRLRGAGHKSQG